MGHLSTCPPVHPVEQSSTPACAESKAGWPILNFAFFAEFRVGNVGCDGELERGEGFRDSGVRTLDLLDLPGAKHFPHPLYVRMRTCTICVDEPDYAVCVSYLVAKR